MSITEKYKKCNIGLWPLSWEPGIIFSIYCLLDFSERWFLRSSIPLVCIYLQSPFCVLCLRDKMNMHHTEGNLLELNSILSWKAVNYDSDHFSEVSLSTQICGFPAFIWIAQKVQWYIQISTENIKLWMSEYLCFYLGFSNSVYFMFA